VNLGINLGIFLINLLQTLICPFVSDGAKALSEDTNWMIILGCTWMIQLVSFVMIMFKYPDASLKDELVNGEDQDEKLNKISKIYKVKD
jgi:hypothetical protein